MSHTIKETRKRNKFHARFDKKPHATRAILFWLSYCLLGMLFIALISINCEAAEFDVDKFLKKTYVSIGAGYKIHESKLYYKNDNGDKYEWNDPYSARIEIGYNYSKNIKFGISHHSQWFSGFPLNDKEEYGKTELFIDYTFTLK